LWIFKSEGQDVTSWT
jgi:hypothetical protein